MSDQNGSIGKDQLDMSDQNGSIGKDQVDMSDRNSFTRKAGLACVFTEDRFNAYPDRALVRCVLMRWPLYRLTKPLPDRYVCQGACYLLRSVLFIHLRTWSILAAFQNILLSNPYIFRKVFPTSIESCKKMGGFDQNIGQLTRQCASPHSKIRHLENPHIFLQDFMLVEYTFRSFPKQLKCIIFSSVQIAPAWPDSVTHTSLMYLWVSDKCVRSSWRCKINVDAVCFIYNRVRPGQCYCLMLFIDAVYLKKRSSEQSRFPSSTSAGKITGNARTTQNKQQTFHHDHYTSSWHVKQDAGQLRSKRRHWRPLQHSILFIRVYPSLKLTGELTWTQKAIFRPKRRRVHGQGACT